MRVRMSVTSGSGQSSSTSRTAAASSASGAAIASFTSVDETTSSPGPAGPPSTSRRVRSSTSEVAEPISRFASSAAPRSTATPWTTLRWSAMARVSAWPPPGSESRETMPSRATTAMSVVPPPQSATR